MKPVYGLYSIREALAVPLVDNYSDLCAFRTKQFVIDLTKVEIRFPARTVYSYARRETWNEDISSIVSAIEALVL